MRYKFFCIFILIISLSTLFAGCDEPEHEVTADPTEPPIHVHTFCEWRVEREASCVVEGLMKRSCNECGKTEEHTVEKLDHALKVVRIVEPDCKNEGYTEQACDCGYTYKKDTVKPLGHDLEKTTLDPTCVLEGYTHYSCKRCEYGFDSDTVKPLGHDLESNTFEPDCTKQGYTHYSCAACDYEFDSDFVKPLGHVSITAKKQYATVNASGYTLYTCNDCGHSYMADYVAYSSIVSGATVENTTVLKKGIDTSKYNHKTGATSNDLLPIDWSAIKAAGVDYVILKAGSSLGEDPAFEMDYAAAKAAGLEVGAYFYAYSTTVGGTVKDAEMLLEWLDGKQFEYPIYFDIEDTTLSGFSKEHLTDMCIAFCERLQSEGYYAAIYANNEWLYRLLDTDKIKSSFDVWYARYPLDTSGEDEFMLDTEAFIWNVEAFGEQMGMWQYTESGRIDGVECKFDFSYAYKDYSGIMKKWGLNGF